MYSVPRRKLLAAAFLTLFSASFVCFSSASATELIHPKSAKENAEITISIIKDHTGDKDLELIISSRALKKPLVLAVPDTNELHINDLPAGHYVLGLREAGAKKFIKMTSMKITEVLK